MLSSCERTAGLTLSSKIVKKGNVEFLIERKSVNWYAEVGNSFWCRDPTNLSAKRGDGFDRLEPRGKAGQGWRYFGVYGVEYSAFSKDDPVSKLAFIDDNTAFFSVGLTLTMDGCKTVIHLNLDDGARFSETMAGKGIRFPEGSIQWGDPFLHKFERLADRACFDVNTAYVVVSDKFKYCTKDQGKVWYLEKQ